MSRNVDTFVDAVEKEMAQNEKIVNDIKKRIDGYKVAYNTMAKSLPTIEKLPE